MRELTSISRQVHQEIRTKSYTTKGTYSDPSSGTLTRPRNALDRTCRTRRDASHQ
jgi:hypothetical protein